MGAARNAIHLGGYWISLRPPRARSHVHPEVEGAMHVIRNHFGSESVRGAKLMDFHASARPAMTPEA